jgi:predicted aminopeptidase
MVKALLHAFHELADQRYDAINRRFADAAKAREQNLVHINQRFDGLKERMEQFHADMLQMRNRLTRLYGLAISASAEPSCWSCSRMLSR